MAGYRGGRIKRIKIHNFMTYDKLELFPKKGLNLILGLNGTGKSSIMCAICLGLAGKPQYTGRASPLSDFIKHGHQEAEIEIDLESKRGDSIVIRRKLKGDKCEWFLNRSPASQNEVIATAKRFNIDTSNLCQFLPQEKVAEFSRMDKKQRLENMLQAIGEPHLYHLFNELKILYRKITEAEQVVKKHQMNKDSAEQQNERISDEVQKQESRVRLKNELNEYYKQKDLALYQEIFFEIEKLKVVKKDKEKKVKVLHNERSSADSKEQSIHKSYVESSRKMEKFKSEKKNSMTQLTNLLSTLNKFNEQVENAVIEFNNRLKEKEAQKKKIHDINKLIEGLEKQLIEEQNKLQNHAEKQQVNKLALTQVHQEVSELVSSIENTTTEKNQVEYSLKQKKKQLESLQDEHNKKMEILKKCDRYTYEAACWLIENRARFKSNVYLPIMLEININSKEYTKYVENSIAFKDLIAFVCENKSDCERLTDILKNGKKLPVNIVMAPETPMSSFQLPPNSKNELSICAVNSILQHFTMHKLVKLWIKRISLFLIGWLIYQQLLFFLSFLISAMYMVVLFNSRKLRKFGLECFLKDLFTAPEPIMRYLCACCNIHRIPVTKSAIPSNAIEFILNRYQVFFSENSKISGRRSKYGQKNLSITKDFILERHLLVNVNDELQNGILLQIQGLEEQLETKRRALEVLQDRLQENEKILEKLRQENKLLDEQKQNVNRIELKYQQKKQYRTQISVVIDEEAVKSKITKKIQAINENRDRVFSQLNSVLKDFSKLEKEIVKLILVMNCLSKNLKITKEANEDINEKVKTAERELQDITNVFREKKSIGHRLAEKIKPYGDDLLKKLIEAPNIVPMELSLDDIEQKINHIQAELNLNEDNEKLVSDYNARKQEIERIQNEISECQYNVDELNEELEAKKKEWLGPLQKHVDNINKKFSRYFKQLSCVGEISLDIPENSKDFTKYGLQIKLKFHEDVPLTELSQTHHSGGECSVAAIVFILSLQELTEVPFRCIDEINQGMDSINERKIYQLIADSVGDDRCSQYFLLTPKLLEGLEYPNEIAVHLIFNSHFLNVKLDVQKHLEIAQAM